LKCSEHAFQPGAYVRREEVSGIRFPIYGIIVAESPLHCCQTHRISSLHANSAQKAVRPSDRSAVMQFERPHRQLPKVLSVITLS
jgi:hypothetical protein